MSVFAALFILMSGTHAQAQLDCAQFRLQQHRQQKLAELSPLAAIPKADLPTLDCAKIEPVKCEDAATRLFAYSENVKMHEQRLLAYLQEVKDTAGNWYTYLCSLENTTQAIPLGYFNVLSVGATDMDDVNSKAAGNHDCLKRDLEEILKTLQSPTCKLSSQ